MRSIKGRLALIRSRAYVGVATASRSAQPEADTYKQNTNCSGLSETRGWQNRWEDGLATWVCFSLALVLIAVSEVRHQ